MVEETVQRVTQYLLDRIEDGLRTVVVVREDGFEIAYLDAGLRDDYTQDTFGEMVESFGLEPPLFEPEIKGQPIGKRRAVVHYHDHAIVLHFPYSETEYMLISVQPDIGRHLLDFLDECQTLVHEAHPDN